MHYYKLFVKNESGGGYLLYRNLKERPEVDKDGYYKLIKEERQKHRSQFIITDEIMKSIIYKYVILEKYDLVSVITDNSMLNKLIGKYIEEMKEDRVNLSLIMMELSRKYSCEINCISFEKFEEKISFESNGIITTNTILYDDTLKFINDVYFRD